jgi:acetolactate synthase I/II/III large subunit
MTKISGGEALARALANEGINFVFSLPSPELDPILAALDDHGIRQIAYHDEIAGVHMAEGLYRETGQVGVVMGNPGPGAGSLFTGALAALSEGVPVVLISAQSYPNLSYPSGPEVYQGNDQGNYFRPFAKYSAPVLVWERIPVIVRQAFREMWHGRPGPVHLDVPAPISYHEDDEANAPIIPPAAYRAGPPQPSEAQIQAAADLLAGAARPIVVAGLGVDRSDANAELMRIVERLNCPVVASISGRSAVPADHPNRFFTYGSGADTARREADVFLVAGSRMGLLDVPFDKYWGDPAGQRLIQIDVDSRNMGLTRPLTLGIVADAKPALAAIGDALAERRIAARDGADLARYRDLDNAYWAEQLAEIATYEGPSLHPAQVVAATHAVFGPEASYFADGGNTSLWACGLLPTTAPRGFHGVFEFGMLGFGIPGAIGGRLGDPNREAVVLTGDGAAGYHVMELQTAAREGIKITAVIFADGQWSMERINATERWGRTFGTAMGPIRWDAVAEGLGCRGLYAESLSELSQALLEAKDSDGPTLIQVKTDADANAFSLPPDLKTRFLEVYLGPGATRFE